MILKRAKVEGLEVHALDGVVDHFWVDSNDMNETMLRLCGAVVHGDPPEGPQSLSELLEITERELTRLSKLGVRIVDHEWVLVDISETSGNFPKNIAHLVNKKNLLRNKLIPAGYMLGAVVEVVDAGIAYTKVLRDKTKQISDSYSLDTSPGELFLYDIHPAQFLPSKRPTKPVFVDIEPRLAEKTQ